MSGCSLVAQRMPCKERVRHMHCWARCVAAGRPGPLTVWWRSAMPEHQASRSIKLPGTSYYARSAASARGSAAASSALAGAARPARPAPAALPLFRMFIVTFPSLVALPPLLAMLLVSLALLALLLTSVLALTSQGSSTVSSWNTLAPMQVWWKPTTRPAGRLGSSEDAPREKAGPEVAIW